MPCSGVYVIDDTYLLVSCALARRITCQLLGNEEGADHLLVNCTLAKKIWEKFLSSFKKAWSKLTNFWDVLGWDLDIRTYLYDCRQNGFLKAYLKKSFGSFGWKETRVFDEKGRGNAQD